MGIYQPNSSSKKLYEKIDNFYGGINIVDESNKLGDNEFRNLENITLMAEGSVKKRTGYKEIFNFKKSNYFKYLFEEIDTTIFKIDANFPKVIETQYDNFLQFEQIIDFAKRFKLLNFDYTLELTFVIDEEIISSYFDYDYFKVENEILQNKDWNSDYFSITDLNPNEISNMKYLDYDYFDGFITTIDITPELKNLNLDILEIKGCYLLVTSSNILEIFISNIKVVEASLFSKDLNHIINPQWILNIIKYDEPKPETLEFEKFEELWSDPLLGNDKKLLGYLIAYTYNNKLWFTFYNLEKDNYVVLDWWLIDDRIYYKENSSEIDKDRTTDRVNQYKFFQPLLQDNPQAEEEIKDNSWITVDIVKTTDYYFNPNSEFKDKLMYSFVGVDIKTYRNKIYITTGYGILEVTNNDILESNNLYEIIPFKPQTAEYQNNYSNLLALNLRSKDPNPPNNPDKDLGGSDDILAYNLETKFFNIWNWDWVSWPKTAHLSGILTKYPPNSKYNTVLRASIDFNDTQMFSKWQYQWRWVAPQEITINEGTIIDNTMPIISDFSVRNFELNWKPIVRPETVNIYTITNPVEQITKQAFIDEAVAKVGANRKIRNFPDFYLGGDDGVVGAALKFKIDKILQQMSGSIDKFNSLDFNGNLLINVELKADARFQNIKLQPCTMKNWRIEVWIDDTLVPGDATQNKDNENWKTKGWWKLQTPEQGWGEDNWYQIYHNYSHRLFSLGIINSEKFLKTVKAAIKSTTVSGYIKILCTLEIGQFATGNAPYNTTTTFGINPNTSQWNANGVTLGLGYTQVDVADSNTIGLTPINNIEQTLNLESLHLLKECTSIEIIKDQLFFWGAKSAPQMIWYSQPFNPGFISIINTIALNRLSNEVIKNIIPFGQNYLIFTDKTIYIMIFTENGIVIEVGNPNYGIEFKDAIIGVGNTIIFLSYDGIYQIRSSGMDINHAIKIRSIDRKIKGLVNLYNLKYVFLSSEGENCLILLIDNDNEYKILNYYSLREVWTQYTTNNNFNFKQLKNINGKLYSLTNNGIFNQWYTQIDEKNLLNRNIKIEDSNEFLLKIMQLYSDSYEYTQTRFEKLTPQEPIPELILTLPDDTILHGLEVIQEAPIQSMFITIDINDNPINLEKTKENNWYFPAWNKNYTDEEVYNNYLSLNSDEIKYFGLLFINYILDYIFYPIECEILTKEFSGAGEYIHNKKKFKEIQLKQIRNVFATKSELTWYTDGMENIYPYEWNYKIDNDNYFITFKKQIQNYQQNSGSYVNESFYVIDPQIEPTTSVYRTKIGDNTEYNARFKKGQKAYVTQIKIVNREGLPFGIKSILLGYKLRKAK